MSDSTGRADRPPGRAVRRSTLRCCARISRDLLRSAGVPVPGRAGGLVGQATVAAVPALIGELYWLARVTLVDRPSSSRCSTPSSGRCSAAWSTSPTSAARRTTHPRRTPSPGEPTGSDDPDAESRPEADGPPSSRGRPAEPTATTTATQDDDEASPTLLAMASEIELLRDRDFADCDDEELALTGRDHRPDEGGRAGAAVPLGAVPQRRAGRSTCVGPCARRAAPAATRSTGHRRRGTPPRQIVMLADVSGSMQAYSRVYLRVLQGAVLGARAHAYVFATRLHPVTRALGRGRREDAIARALTMSPDASGGTRIGGAVKDFLDTDGRRGLARGAVVVVVSDGWERADPALLGEQMARLSRLAHRVIWVNPRKAAPGFAPLTGGMAAALPHVDTFVSGHSARSVQELLDAIAAA